MIPIAWSWREGTVHTRNDHIKVSYYGIRKEKDEHVLVALVAPPVEHSFTIQFLLGTGDKLKEGILQEVMRQLDLVLPGRVGTAVP